MTTIADHTHKQTPGWLIPYMIDLDTLAIPGYTGHGRWDYWLTACMAEEIPEAPIPHIAFAQHPTPASAKHVQNCLRYHVQNTGAWYDDAWLLMVKWLLHGFGVKDLAQIVERQIPADTRNFWYTQFNLGELLRTPVDWSAYILQGGLPAMKAAPAKWAKSTGFFATPMNVIKVMTKLTMGTDDPEALKRASVLDPCCGTGSMLLEASNYSLRLYGQDIVPELCQCTKLNGWLWAPWLVHSTPTMRQLLDAKTDNQPPESFEQLSLWVTQPTP